jgi:hypothetical protein
MGLKSIPSHFSIDSEEDLRRMVSEFFSELDFDSSEMSFEDRFSITLGQNVVTIEKKVIGGRSDILLTRHGKPLAIIETKKTDHELTTEDAQQALSYARLLRDIAPFAILTNGEGTKVFDVITGNEIGEDPRDSTWQKNGQQLAGINDELKYEAARNLITVNPDTLTVFCLSQLENGLKDLKSNVGQNKRYNPEVYVRRTGLEDSFSRWLQSEQPIFAVVAHSGYGKTNFMCAKAEECSSSNYVLFYSGGRLTRGILPALQDDFIWEFHKNREVVHLFNRLEAIAQASGKKFLIFVDAIDEFAHGNNELKNEILLMVARLGNYSHIRLIISCKSFDWYQFVTDGNQSYNQLAEVITPDCRQWNVLNDSIDSSRIGIILGEFTDQELSEAIQKYSVAYFIKGTFQGELLLESHNPLMLRFLAEVYGNNEQELQSTITSNELFDLYIRRKVGLINNPGIAEQILIQLANLVFKTNSRIVAKDRLLSKCPWDESYEKSLRDLLRLGIISLTVDSAIEQIGYEFNKLLLYIYVFKARKLHTLPVEEQLAVALEFTDSELGIEALEFFLVVASQDIVHAFLKGFAKKDLPIYADLITGLREIEKYSRQPIPERNILNYLDFYNYLRQEFFPETMHITMPYINRPLGLLFFGKSSTCQFRACTDMYPLPIAVVEDQDGIQQLIRGNAHPILLNDVMPVGSIHLGGNHDFVKFPQKASFEHLEEEIFHGITNRMLIENQNPEMLKERVYSILLHEPSIWLEGDDLPHARYLKILGFEDEDTLGNTTIKDIIEAVNRFLKVFIEKAQKNDQLSPSYQMRCNHLLVILFALSQLDPTLPLGKLNYSLDRFWEYMDKDLTLTRDELIPFVPQVRENYKIMFEVNFPKLVPYSNFLSNIDKLSMIEITRDKQHSDFLILSYIVTPNKDKSFPLLIHSTPYANSITHDLHFQTKMHNGYSRSDEGCGYIVLDTTINGVHLYDNQAWVIKTSFPSRTPILDQVYQLLFFDLEYILRSEKSYRSHNPISNLENGPFMDLVARWLLSSRRKGTANSK